MLRHLRPLAAPLLGLVVACAGSPARPVPKPLPAAPSASSSQAPSAPRPRTVVVALVVDQLAAWVLQSRIGALPATGGFARLAGEGTYVEDLRYDHAITETAPGHAALFTGGPPSRSGIVANERIDLASRKKVSFLRDAAVRLVTTEGIADAPGSSLASLKNRTVADLLRAAEPRARIYSISLKDRGAIFGGGAKPDASLWFDPNRDAFVSSTAFAKELPTWAKAKTAARTEHPRWEPLDPTWLHAHAAGVDRQEGEGDLVGMGLTFPHPVTSGHAFRATPFADEALVELGLRALDSQAGDAPVMLSLSFSSNDYVGHVFGAESWEAWDELYRLDALLGRFFVALDQRYGTAGWSALLSADHGVAPLPELTSVGMRPWCAKGAPPDRWQRPCVAGIRLQPDAMAEELRTVAKAIVGEGDFVLGLADPYVWLTPAGRALPAERKKKLLDALAAHLRKTPGVERVVFTQDACTDHGGDTVDELVCRSIDPSAGGELYVVVGQTSFFDPEYVIGKGVSHGTPLPFDRSVPFLARSPERIPAGVVTRTPMPIAAYARTLASLLGIEAPADATKAPTLTQK